MMKEGRTELGTSMRGEGERETVSHHGQISRYPVFPFYDANEAPPAGEDERKVAQLGDISVAQPGAKNQPIRGSPFLDQKHGDRTSGECSGTIPAREIGGA